MHYKNGREAKVGDHVLVNGWSGKFIGTITHIQPGSGSCNATVIPHPVQGQTVTLGEVLHVDDATQKPVETAPAT